jgi:two-component system LytT family sensor kinase
VLIPKFLFQNRTGTFAYLVFATFLVTLWIAFFSVFLILFYSVYYLPELIIPSRKDIIILITGNYLIIILAVVIHFIKESYSKMAEKKELEKQQLLTKTQLQDTQLKLLQGQLHPHFLFNMLNNIYGLIKQDSDKARIVVLKTAELLDYMLYDCTNTQIPLAHEVHFIENYLSLEKIRSKALFNVNFTITGSVGNTQLPPLLLFPFVENAFKHGKNSRGEFNIDMQLSIGNKTLTFTVTNSTEENPKDAYLETESKGIGLKNVEKRLAILYDPHYEFTIDKTKTQFSATLKIPLK